MAAKTTSRPVDLPRATATPRQTQGASVPLPDGVMRLSRSWVDDRGLPRRSHEPVPVDVDDRRTPHKLARCPHEATVNGGGKQQCGYRRWLLPDQKQFCPDHGGQLVVPKEGSRIAAVAADAVRMYRMSAAPWAIPAGALLADATAGLAGLSASNVLAATPLLAGGAYYTTKRTLTRRAIKRRKIEQGQRTGRRLQAIRRRSMRAAVTAAEAGVWTTALVGTGMTSSLGWVVAAAGAVRWAVGAKQWWDGAENRRVRDLLPEVQAPVDEPLVEAPDPVQLRAVTTWKTLIGCKNGPLADTELADFQRLPNCAVDAHSRTQLPNWSAKVVPLVAGSINMREYRPHLLGRIAAAYHCTYADVSFAADESDIGIGWVRVQPDNVLAETNMWPGPAAANDWKRGRSRIGRYDDGEPIWYVWWTKDGAAHDLISGCSGSGKSELVAQLSLNGLHSDGLVLDWLADPQGGQSYGRIKDEVDWFARDLSEIKLMLLAALKEMLRRNDELTRSYIKTWRPTKKMPLLVITLDEVQAYIEDPIILELVTKLVGQGRKCGIKMRLITQIPAAYNLGGSTYIKEQLKTGQSLILRAMTDQAGRDATDGDCPINPTLLPSKWGKNTCAAGETTAGLLFVQGLTGRDVYGRASWTGDDMLPWLVDADGQRTVCPGVFGSEAQQVSGPLWGDRKERAKLLLAAGRSDHDLLSGGKAVELIETAAVNTPVGQPAPAAVQDTQPTQTACDTVLAAALQVADSGGVAQRADIVKEVGGKVAPGTLNKALTDLVADGYLRRVRNGVYEVTR